MNLKEDAVGNVKIADGKAPPILLKIKNSK